MTDEQFEQLEELNDDLTSAFMKRNLMKDMAASGLPELYRRECLIHIEALNLEIIGTFNLIKQLDNAVQDIGNDNGNDNG
jgi:hypothetical protein